MSNELIKIENLSKDYNTPTGILHALADINVVVEQGDIYGIIGLSGAGKSTLIRCVNLLEVPTSGSVYFDGVDLTKVPTKVLLEKRRKMGMIFQSFNLFDQRNVFRNVAYPLELEKVSKEEIKVKVNELLKIVGLEDKANSYPSQLSGGQQQRVAIARALANDPKVVLCDEPTSALDPNTTNQILDLLKEINEKLGVTIIIITHEMRVIESICNKVSIIDQSHIVEDGLVSDIFKSPKSAIARQLILPGGIELSKLGNKYLRIVYDGNVDEPILSNLIIECKCEINILSSNTKIFENKVYGQMIIQIPEDKSDLIRMWLSNKKISVEEVANNDAINN